MKSKLYVAKYSTGSYDDHYFVSVFVSEDREFVEKRGEKFNTKLAYWKEYFKQFGKERFNYEILDEAFYDKDSANRFYQIMECNRAFVDGVEYRNPRKKEDKTDE